MRILPQLFESISEHAFNPSKLLFFALLLVLCRDQTHVRRPRRERSTQLIFQRMCLPILGRQHLCLLQNRSVLLQWDMRRRTHRFADLVDVDSWQV